MGYVVAAVVSVVAWVGLNRIRTSNVERRTSNVELDIKDADLPSTSTFKVRRSTFDVRIFCSAWAHRFRRPLPLIYLFLLAGSFLGGIFHAPNNYDMLTYRIPRILNWLADGHWHWIPGYIDRMNYSGTGWEWMVLPLLLLARGTSLFFLINIISYLLLPGLFFAMLRGFGVGRRMAWTWMWLLPAGLNFVMQAGGGANDTVSAVYFLAALAFAFRARRTGNVNDVYWSLIAAGLLTACKSSNLPLALPCVVALIPAIPLLKHHLRMTAVVLTVAMLCSLLPTLLLNFKYTHDIAGSPDDPGKLKIHNPLAGVLGNTLQIAVTNLQPPVMPIAQKWNELSRHLLPPAIDRFLEREFPRFTLHMGELPQEEQAGLGIGLTAMAALCFAATILGLRRRKQPCQPAWVPIDRWRWPVIIAGYLSMLVFMSMLGSEASPRLASPYYPILLVPLLLHPINDSLARRRWWRVCAVLAALAVVPGLILTPSRPLFPAVSWSAALARKLPNNTAARRAAVVYAVYANRAQNLAPLSKYIPEDQSVIGLVGSADSSETPLWKIPGQSLGSRRVIELLLTDGIAKAKSQGIRYVALGTDGLEEQDSSIEKFLANFGGKIVGRESITIKVTEGAEEWYVVDLK